jgi:hypothetical protein
VRPEPRNARLWHLADAAEVSADHERATRDAAPLTKAGGSAQGAHLICRRSVAGARRFAQEKLLAVLEGIVDPLHRRWTIGGGDIMEGNSGHTVGIASATRPWNHRMSTLPSTSWLAVDGLVGAG